jgi:hypothetical protein
MENRPLFNKVANEILLEVKPLKLRERIIRQVLDLIDEEKDISYRDGLANGCKCKSKKKKTDEYEQLSIFDLEACCHEK